MLSEALAGRANLVPLERFGFLLRDLYPNEINEGAFGQVVEQLERIRASQPQPQPQMQQPMPGEGQQLPVEPEPPVNQAQPGPDTAN
jgi:hypothetical protein